MAAADTRELQLQISASAELLIRNLKIADNAVADFQKHTDARLASVDSHFAALGALKGKLAGLGEGLGLGDIVGAASVATLVELAKGGLEYASSLAEEAQQLGVTSKDLQEYRYAASQVGIAQEDMDKGLAKLTLSMGQARDGVEKPKRAFAELAKLLGKDVLTSAATAGEAIPLIADALAKVPDPAKRAAFEVELFGKTGQKLDNLLSGGAEGVNSLTAAAKDLGLVLSEKQIADADNAADKISELKQVLAANIASEVADNAKAIYAFVEALEKLVAKSGAAINKLGILRDYLRIAEDTVTGDLTNLAKDRQDLAARQNYGKPFFGDAARSSVDAYFQRVTAGHGAGAGTSPEAAKAAAEKAAREAEEARRKAEAAAKKDRADQRKAGDLLSRGEVDLASSKADLSNDPDERLKIEMQRVDLARAGKDADLENEAVDNRYIAANLDRLKKLNADNAEIDKRILVQKRAQQAAQDAFELQQAGTDDLIAEDEIRVRLAIVAKDRYALERRLLAERQQQERNALDEVVNDETGRYSAADKAIAAKRLKDRPGIEQAQRDDLAQQQRGPLASYRDQLKAATGDMNEALQNVEVHGLQSLEDGLLGVIDGTESVGDAFKKMASSIIADLARIAIEKAIVGALGGGFFGIHLADGGPVLHRATGGPVFGPGGPREDRIPAMLSAGEYIINAAAYARNPALVEAINAGRLPRFADGGLVGRLPSVRASTLPNLSGRGSMDRLDVQSTVKVEPSPLLITTIQQNTLRTVAASAEPIMAGAEARTRKGLSRPSLPGGWG